VGDTPIDQSPPTHQLLILLFQVEVANHAGLVVQLARAALGSPTVRYAASRPHWRETYTGTRISDRILEGVIDLLYRDDDGMVIVDYKTDAAPVPALASRVDYYRPQMAAYAYAVEAATAEPVVRCILLFLTPGGAHTREVGDVPEAIRQVHDVVMSG